VLGSANEDRQERLCGIMESIARIAGSGRCCCYPPDPRRFVREGVAGLVPSLIASTAPFLVAVVDFESGYRVWRDGDKVCCAPDGLGGLDLEMRLDHVQRLALQLRNDIEVLGTSQLLILLLVVSAGRFREVAAQVFSPRFTHGDFVVRVLADGPALEEASERWQREWRLDLEMIRPNLLPEKRLSVLDRPRARELADLVSGVIAAASTLKDLDEKVLKPASGIIREALLRDDADSDPVGTARRMCSQLLDLVDGAGNHA